MERYAPFPPIVFSPEGRLFQVEQNAQRASDRKDISSSLVVALQFGGLKDPRVLVLSTCSRTPLLYSVDADDVASGDAAVDTAVNVDDVDTINAVDAAKTEQNKERDTREQHERKQYMPLWKYDIPQLEEESHERTSMSTTTSRQRFVPSMPLSLISHNLLIGTGGNAVDSRVLMERIQKLALSMTSQDGGSCMQGNYGIRGHVWSGSLAKKVADMLQVPTQNVGEGSIGRMLAVSEQ